MAKHKAGLTAAAGARLAERQAQPALAQIAAEAPSKARRSKKHSSPAAIGDFNQPIAVEAHQAEDIQAPRGQRRVPQCSFFQPLPTDDPFADIAFNNLPHIPGITALIKQDNDLRRSRSFDELTYRAYKRLCTTSCDESEVVVSDWQGVYNIDSDGKASAIVPEFGRQSARTADHQTTAHELTGPVQVAGRFENSIAAPPVPYDAVPVDFNASCFIDECTMECQAPSIFTNTCFHAHDSRSSSRLEEGADVHQNFAVPSLPAVEIASDLSRCSIANSKRSRA